MDVAVMRCADVREAGVHGKYVVDDFSDAVTDEDELRSASEVSEKSDDSGKPDQAEDFVDEDASGVLCLAFGETKNRRVILLQHITITPAPCPKTAKKLWYLWYVLLSHRKTTVSVAHGSWTRWCLRAKAKTSRTADSPQNVNPVHAPPVMDKDLTINLILESDTIAIF